MLNISIPDQAHIYYARFNRSSKFMYFWFRNTSSKTFEWRREWDREKKLEMDKFEDENGKKSIHIYYYYYHAMDPIERELCVSRAGRIKNTFVFVEIFNIVICWVDS